MCVCVCAGDGGEGGCIDEVDICDQPSQALHENAYVLHRTQVVDIRAILHGIKHSSHLHICTKIYRKKIYKKKNDHTCHIA